MNTACRFFPGLLILALAANIRASSYQFECSFPSDLGEAAQPLLCTGSPGRGDTILVARDSSGALRVGWEHGTEGAIWSEPFREQDRPRHSVRVRLAPSSGTTEPDSPSAFAGDGVFVLIDGRVALSARGEVFPDTAERTHFGENVAGAAFAARPLFSGKILGAVSWDPVEAGRECVQLARWVSEEKDGRMVYPGSVSIVLSIPAGRSPQAEPIVVAGVPGKADMVFLSYVDEDHVAVGLDHWGVGGPVSRAVKVDHAATHVLTVDMDCLHGVRTGAKTRVSMDGIELISTTIASYPSPLEEIYLGVNSVGASTAVHRFSGRIFRVSAP